ncbi:aminodeoxychorismate/anthranilate synthase component II [Rhizobium leguminosarum]|uniref:anthranilate synthase component II n=1 Tax=Rhizobium TaxID=379 RepID=UPI00102FB29B|nr:aminodeoxychorismate/anthranilate synthase component II [Rhizobium leguminosarum]TBF87875.1 aminodeoxychorismate/anthranilate synthase component II [Rhizobium leguminosarum]TBG07144.1 aminodeoxychorismate/anthranilate synthase component II [Rhizobium leguminosarum]TBG07708.1 aminodeoxychorismate/anthranilate synthase component II [Rhizobium leguminosarum]TBG30828.1 aminodeoxychorismate/anthranilate synthase component II [Rhizobium leguminosarum]TBG50074.1 aminodeoxychorismate/anthranilate s
MRILLIDNYDSFTHNLRELIYKAAGTVANVRYNDAVRAIDLQDADTIVISPGPGHPSNEADFGICAEVIRQASQPVLGICLGHQGIATALGGTVEHAPFPVHGQVDEIGHDGQGLFERIPQNFKAVRYHSLAVTNLPENVVATARTRDGIIMGLQHVERPIFGVQFHPESICSEFGVEIISNFLKAVR